VRKPNSKKVTFSPHSPEKHENIRPRFSPNSKEILFYTKQEKKAATEEYQNNIAILKQSIKNKAVFKNLANTATVDQLNDWQLYTKTQSRNNEERIKQLEARLEQYKKEQKILAAVNTIVTRELECKKDQV